jgi:hypothetical protein
VGPKKKKMGRNAWGEEQGARDGLMASGNKKSSNLRINISETEEKRSGKKKIFVSLCLVYF